jgi:hypothetical protein
LAVGTAWRLETLGFSGVYDYAAGKADWLAAGLPIEGALAGRTLIGSLADPNTPSCGLGEPLGEVRERLRIAGRELAVVLNTERVVLGVLGADAWEKDPSLPVEVAMLEGPVTFRPSTSPEDTAHWMEHHDAREVLVTSSDGRLIGMLDIDVARRAANDTNGGG